MYRFGICWGGRDDRTPASELDTRPERVDERSRVSDFQASDQRNKTKQNYKPWDMRFFKNSIILNKKRGI